MKYVGEAVREFALTKDKQVLLGIANWTTIKNRENLCRNFNNMNVKLIEMILDTLVLNSIFELKKIGTLFRSG